MNFSIPVAATATLILFLSFTTTTVTAIGSAATLAIIQSSSTVCGLLSTTNTIQCIHLNSSSPRPFSLLPKTTFNSIAASRGNLCGLRTGGAAFIAWNATSSSSWNFPHKRIYHGRLKLAELTAGEDHFAAVDVNHTKIMWWRENKTFEKVFGDFHSLTSGHGFSCAIFDGLGKVRCWGSNGTAIQAQFDNRTMSSIIAGDSHMCGLSTDGCIVCGGANYHGQSSPPECSQAFEFRSLALGLRHTCAVRRRNGTVLCWGGDAAGIEKYYTPVNDTEFEFLVGGGEFTCGLRTKDFAVLCWPSSARSIGAATKLALSAILPGICTFNQSSCQCGIYPNSQTLCSNSAVICRQCDEQRNQASSPVSPPTSSSCLKCSRSRLWLALMIAGSTGGFAGVCTILFWLWFGICRHNKVHNSVQPTIGSTNPTAGTNFVPSFKSHSTSRLRIFRPSRNIRRQRSGPSSFKDGAVKFTFAELAAATNDFSPENKIGAGSFGSVYKGKLADRREVAIKRGEPGTKIQWLQEKELSFQSELALLSRLNHKHLVELVGYCKEDDERLLVYEFMKNGALYDHLHSTGRQDSLVLNSWKMRIKVLTEAARGIEYLHNYAIPQIIHRDIKSSNILLDANWVAKVSDFGLSMMGTGSESGHLSKRAAGTLGYIDPEYYGTRRSTVKSDVYSLGVVMLETLTGKRAIFQDEDGNPTSVVDYALPFISASETDKVVDTRLRVLGLNEKEAVELVAYTAIHCLIPEGRERPGISDVVANLEGALAMCQDSSGTMSSSLELVGRD